MLKIVRSIRELDFRNLADVYEQSCIERGSKQYGNYPTSQQMLLSEQDLYGEVKCFLADPKAFYALWEEQGRYISVLRMEPYKDGLLLEGLETVPAERKKGYAKRLIMGVLAHLERSGAVIYSHVEKKNTASMAVHLSCGFEKISDHAVYVDGSVSYNGYTLQKKL